MGITGATCANKMSGVDMFGFMKKKEKEPVQVASALNAGLGGEGGMMSGPLKEPAEYMEHLTRLRKANPYAVMGRLFFMHEDEIYNKNKHIKKLEALVREFVETQD